MQNESKLIIDR